MHHGVVVIDATTPTDPVSTDYLTAPAMLDPMETLKVNHRRQLLAAVHSVTAAKAADIAVYDLSADCRFPRLLSRGSARSPDAAAGVLRINEGAFSPDGFTYYATNLRDGLVDVIDMTNAAAPTIIAAWSMPFNQRTSGLAISSDGRRAYLTLYGQGAAAPTSEGAPRLTNGLIIVDVSEVQTRNPNPQPRVVSSLVWGDGSASHQMLPVKVNGRDYLIATDEGGSGYSNSSGWKASCDQGLPPWSMARIIDISDEAQPKVVAKLKLEMNDAKNCPQVLPDLTGLSGFTYGSHYCSVDDDENATAMACGYFESGIRVFDIRDPARPREIAYYVPPIVNVPSPASFNSATTANGRPDHCSAHMRFDKGNGTLMTTCQDNGFLVLKFTNGAWPFANGAVAGVR